MITIDGSYGEGGGQILRSSLTLAVLTGQAVKLTNIRAKRSKPGLRPQHLTAVRAAARLCNANVESAALNSQSLTFTPQSPPQPGVYVFDVNDAATYASAGATTLILQTVLLPLALAPGPSRVTLLGGTHVPMSPPAIYLEQVYLPILFEMGIRAHLNHQTWGFAPAGGGKLEVEITGGSRLQPLDLSERGAMRDVNGLAFASELPPHIPQRMSDHATTVLRQAGCPHVTIKARQVPAGSIGTGIFLLARYKSATCPGGARAGFDALGRRGLPAEQVAETACHDLLNHHRTGAAVDPHLADQLALPFALAGGVSRARVSRITQHLITNLWVIRQFGLADVRMDGQEGEPGAITVGTSTAD
ncbi:MAG: RNA 3'-phosphate cyclase [Anaerolineae bacterium]|nr:RNA 3'-phosphate cyclase [Anaerolineae bacterium]